MFYYPMSDFATTFALYADAVKGCVRYKCYSSIPRFAVHSPRGCVGRFAEGSAKVSDADQPLSLMVLPSCPKCGKELAAGTEFCVFCGASTKPDFSSPNAPKSQKGRHRNRCGADNNRFDCCGIHGWKKYAAPSNRNGHDKRE